jgi:hypothetical protein
MAWLLAEVRNIKKEKRKIERKAYQIHGQLASPSYLILDYADHCASTAKLGRQISGQQSRRAFVLLAMRRQQQLTKKKAFCPYAIAVPALPVVDDKLPRAAIATHCVLHNVALPCTSDWRKNKRKRNKKKS